MAPRGGMNSHLASKHCSHMSSGQPTKHWAVWADVPWVPRRHPRRVVPVLTTRTKRVCTAPSIAPIALFFGKIGKRDLQLPSSDVVLISNVNCMTKKDSPNPA